MSVTFAGGRRGWATTIQCQLCKKYEHEHASHFAYLSAEKSDVWEFASLRDADIEVLMARIEAEETAKASGAELDLTEVEKVKCRRRLGQKEVVQACFKCCGLKLHNNEFAFAKMANGACIEPSVPNNQFKKLSNKTMKSEASEESVRNLLGRVERTLGQETAQKLRVDLTTLRDTRVSKASDWVSQLSSTEVKAEILDCQLLYSCQVCHLLPARAASWYLLESPHTSRRTWVCARCGHKWGGCASQRILVVKVTSGAQAVLCEIPASVPAQLENQMSLLRLVHVARKLKPGEPSAEDILAVIGELAAVSETRMKAYSVMFQQKATSDYQERFHASKLLCEHETLSLRGPGQMFQALEVPPELPRIDLAALQQIIHLAASTLDLEVVRQHEDVGKEKKRALNALVHDSSAALKRFNSKEGW